MYEYTHESILCMYMYHNMFSVARFNLAQAVYKYTTEQLVVLHIMKLR